MIYERPTLDASRLIDTLPSAPPRSASLGQHPPPPPPPPPSRTVCEYQQCGQPGTLAVHPSQVGDAAAGSGRQTVPVITPPLPAVPGGGGGNQLAAARDDIGRRPSHSRVTGGAALRERPRRGGRSGTAGVEVARAGRNPDTRGDRPTPQRSPARLHRSLNDFSPWAPKTALF